MRHLVLSMVATLAAASLVLAGCGQAAPAPAPTQAPAAKAAAPTQPPAAPTQAPAPKPAEPTKAAAPAPAPTAAPTAAPAKKVDFPQKGKAITIIVPFDAGGPTDVQARLTAQLLEKEVGTSVEVVNRPGASGQTGTMEMVKAKPDGYTLGLVPIPTTIQVYLDPERKAPYGRKDILPLASQVWDPGAVAVRADSPYKSMNDLVAAAKTQRLKMATVGVMTNSHLWVVMLEKASGVSFALVHFTGSAPATTALLGGHVDALIQATGGFLTISKSGQGRVLGLMDKEESKFFPGTKTFEAQGLKLYAYNATGYALPAGTPKEVVDLLESGIKKVTLSKEFETKLEEAGKAVHYIGSAEFSALWDQMEAEAKPLMSLLTTK